jgi:uridine phosphorylase
VDGLKLGHYAILGALLPVISRRTDESKQSFRKGFILLTGLSLLMAGGLALFPRLIILILYGEKFVTAIPLLALLGWSLIPYTVSSFFSYDLIARGRETSLVKATAVSLVIFLGLYLWLISLYQLNGAIYAALVGEIMQATILVIARSGALAPRRSNLLPPHGDSFLKTRTDLPSLMTSDSDPILTPSALLAYRRANGQLTGFPAPRAVIFAPQKSLADYILRLHPTKRIEGFLGEFHLLKRASGQIALSSGFGIGAPVIAGLADEFAALGVKQFVSIGMAGGLQPELTTGSLVIARRAIRGEGVSRHYLPPDETVESDSDLVQGIGHILTRQDHPHHLGTTWTTDAPFRELRKDVLEHQKQGVLAVDMEAAAMMAVARSHDLSAVAIFSIADQLSGGEWRMADDLRPAQKGLSVLFDAVYEHLSQR